MCADPSRSSQIESWRFVAAAAALALGSMWPQNGFPQTGNQQAGFQQAGRAAEASPAAADKSVKSEAVLGLAESTRQAHSVGQILLENQVLEWGGSSRIGLKIRLDPQWHTYWSNPGDSGAPPRFEVRVIPPESDPNFWLPRVEDVEFPTPIRIDQPPLTSFAYEGEVMFTRRLRWPAGRAEELQRAGKMPSTLHIEVDAEWLVCLKECIPARQKWKWDWPIGQQGLPSTRQAEFLLNEEHLPKPWSASTWKMEGRELQLFGLGSLLSADPTIEVVDFFPSVASGLSLSRPSIERIGERVHLAFAEPPNMNDPNANKPSMNQAEPWGLVLLQSASSGSVQAFELRGEGQTLTWWRALLFAWAGGLILNLMPCVLPVISLKMLSLGKLAQQNRREVSHQALAYTFGVLTCMWLIGAILAGLRLTGESLGWGFQMQSPHFVIFMFALFLAMTWSLLGRWDWGGRWMGWGEGLTRGGGRRASFFTGLLAVIVASPCTAPLMAPAMGFALTAPMGKMFLSLTALGLGLATPYLLLVGAPSILKLWPRPGAWMNRLKLAMAVGLAATSLWLLWILSTLWTPIAAAIVGAAGILMLLAMEFQRLRWVSALVFVAAGGLLMFASRLPSETTPVQDSFWQSFSPQAVEQARREGRGVFINYTATWCLTCQVNDRVVFRDSATRAWLKERGVVMFKADWTKSDSVITESLKSFGRAGVPLYVYYPPNGEAKLLAEVLTPAGFRDEIDSAHAGRPVPENTK